MNEPKGPICLLCKQESKWVALGSSIGCYWYCVSCKLEEQEWLKKAKQPSLASGAYKVGQWVKCVTNIQPMVHLTIDKAYKIVETSKNMGKQSVTVVDDKGRIREFNENRFQHTLPAAPMTAATPARQGYVHMSSNGMTIGMAIEATATHVNNMGSRITFGSIYTIVNISSAGLLQITDDLGMLAYHRPTYFQPYYVGNTGTGRITATGTSLSGNSSSPGARTSGTGPLTGLTLTAGATIPGLNSAPLILKGQNYGVIDHDPISNQVFVRNDYGDARWYPLPNFIVPPGVAPLKFAPGNRIVLKRGRIIPRNILGYTPVPGKTYMVLHDMTPGVVVGGTAIINDGGDIILTNPTDADFDPVP